MPHDLRLQHPITNAAHQCVDYVGGQVVSIEHVESMVRDVLDRLVVVASGVKFAAVVSASKREVAYHIQVSRHMDLDEPGWCGHSVLIGDGERDEVFPNVVDKSLGRFDWSHCLRCCCTCVSWGGRWPYRLGSRNSPCLPSMLSSTYAHPLGRPFIRWDERGCWYFDGIFVIFVNELGNLSCQHGDIRVCKMNSGHLLMWWCGWGSDKYGCDRCWYQNWIGGVVSVAVLHGPITSSTVSIIWLIVWVTGIIPAVHLAWFCSSIRCRAVRSCS